jgi:hypothetical protein
MSEPSRQRESRMESLAPGIPVGAKVALLLGLAGGLFLAIILSYTDPDAQYLGLGIGIGLGLVAALVVLIRDKRGNRTVR